MMAGTVGRSMKVMVAIDDSEGSFHALQWTLDNLSNVIRATPIDDGMVTLVHVQEPFQHRIFPVGSAASTAVYLTSTAVENIRKSQQENSARILSRALQICEAKMVKAETLILDGEPREMICQAAEQMNVDLLVVGSRGFGMIKRTLLGSVSDYCAHHAKCPILIVKPPREQQQKSK
ncbi:universal stress protein A-like protein isoform X1 [Tripterygium wilfordii]|uniref:universal stress protein A-like protein isoform X1 n=1 Tax=Tripterygium wilfordii TaxID=458696 RepID=UPI0018F80753|nr:universal stress protein A-like protein isoform X1 [Tripterygium wilfordii]